MQWCNYSLVSMGTYLMAWRYFTLTLDIPHRRATAVLVPKTYCCTHRGFYWDVLVQETKIHTILNCSLWWTEEWSRCAASHLFLQFGTQTCSQFTKGQLSCSVFLWDLSLHQGTNKVWDQLHCLGLRPRRFTLYDHRLNCQHLQLLVQKIST